MRKETSTNTDELECELAVIEHHLLFIENAKVEQMESGRQIVGKYHFDRWESALNFNKKRILSRIKESKSEITLGFPGILRGYPIDADNSGSMDYLSSSLFSTVYRSKSKPILVPVSKIISANPIMGRSAKTLNRVWMEAYGKHASPIEYPEFKKSTSPLSCVDLEEPENLRQLRRVLEHLPSFMQCTHVPETYFQNLNNKQMKKKDVNIEDYSTYNSTAHNLGLDRKKGVEDIILLSVKEQVIKIKIEEVKTQLEGLREDAGAVDRAICNISEYLKLDLPVHAQLDGAHYCIDTDLKVKELNDINSQAL